MGLPKDVIVVTPEEVERDRNLVGTIIHPALREGKVLHDRSVWAFGRGQNLDQEG
jgi:hypothetical protein